MDRFLYLIILFLISIYILILRPNILSIILGSDGLGLISYCLVSYYIKIKSFTSGIVIVIFVIISISISIQILSKFWIFCGIGDEACINYPYFSFFYIFSI